MTGAERIPRKSPRYGECGYERVDHDAYFTIDHAVTAAALRHLPLRRDGAWWEPCAGGGHMARVMAAAHGQVVASDLLDRGWPLAAVPFRVADFLAGSPGWEPALAGIRLIMTNPPFRDGAAEACCRRALELMAPGRGQVAMLLPADFDYAASRLDLFAGHPAFAGKLAITWRIRWFERGAQSSKSARQNFAWFFWDWQGHGAPALRYARRGTDGDVWS